MQQLSAFVVFTFMYYRYMILVTYADFITLDLRIYCLNENSLMKY